MVDVFLDHRPHLGKYQVLRKHKVFTFMLNDCKWEKHLQNMVVTHSAWLGDGRILFFLDQVPKLCFWVRLEAGVASDSPSLLLHDIPRPVGFTSKGHGAQRKEQGPPWWDGGWVVPAHGCL